MIELNGNPVLLTAIRAGRLGADRLADESKDKRFPKAYPNTGGVVGIFPPTRRRSSQAGKKQVASP
ncbi:MAG: hypothetical protein WA417_03755 [Stellaceae bacterium]|jgi:hypothetical protein